jgi:hypothetical protein
LYPLVYDRIFLALQRLLQALYLISIALDHPIPLPNQMVLVSVPKVIESPESVGRFLETPPRKKAGRLTAKRVRFG